ncbi:MAG: hypothetical protein CH6_0087 [Candidatus Kapaibacterium sp.]|nr:MAG: hypothetical protein CH6_0087 [Candidatus Kapabacteria bacterium]
MLAKTTIHHGGNEKTGSTPVLRTIFMYVDGIGEVQMPYINGNAIRGKLRRMLMNEYFEILGLTPEDLNPKVYHIFFSGGALEAAESNNAGIDLSLRREIRDTFPHLSLLGGSIGNQIIQGKLKVGHAFPVCKEYAVFLPNFLQNDERTNRYVRSFCDESFQTRRDDLRANRQEDEQAVQMKVDFECFIPGTKFYHWFVTEYANEIEASVFGRLIELFRFNPWVGGLSGTGNGEVLFEYTPEPPSGNLYLAHIRDNKDKILNLLNRLSDML